MQDIGLNSQNKVKNWAKKSLFTILKFFSMPETKWNKTKPELHDINSEIR